MDAETLAEHCDLDMLSEQPRPLDHLALCGAPDSQALVLRDEILDYATLEKRVGQMAQWLRSARINPGDRVASWLPKQAMTCLLPLAAARVGAVHVPINPALKHAQAAHILSDSKSRLLVSNPARLATLAPGDLPADCIVINDSDAMAGVIAEHNGLPPSDWPTDTLTALLYTSGSTGKPKGVMLSHANLWLGAQSVAQYLRLASTDRTLCVLPLSFDYGQNQLLSTWRAGGAAVPIDYLLPRDVVRACAKAQITTLAAVPPLWVQLVEQPWPPEALKNLRRITNSGGALNPALVRQLRTTFGGVDIFAMYGLTEAFRSTYLDPALIDSHPQSIGKAIPFAEVLVINDCGEQAAVGEEGELVHAGPLVAQGYWQDPARTAERFRPAPASSRFGGTAVWSGDRVVRDAGGRLSFVGRRDAMIKSSGIRISPNEIEDAALASNLVAEAAALGVPDAQLGEAIILFIRPKPEGLIAATLIEGVGSLLKRDLPGFMLPGRIIVLDSFPKTPNGKIDRIALDTMAKEVTP